MFNSCKNNVCQAPTSCLGDINVYIEAVQINLMTTVFSKCYVVCKHLSLYVIRERIDGCLDAFVRRYAYS